jgi:hypothetical protein
MRTVFKENFLLQKLKRSSRLGPNKSRTKTLYSPSTPNHLMFGIPAAETKQDSQSPMIQSQYTYPHKDGELLQTYDLSQPE